MHMPRALVLAPVLGILLAVAPAQANRLQALIDAAQPGDIVQVPAGVHEGAIALKPGVFLVGEGADSTIIDGAGAEVVVSGAKKAAILGVTIRNGRTLVHNGGMFMGVFECTLESFNLYGARFEGGSGILANSRVTGQGNAFGVASIGANPLVVNNLIENNQIGLLVAYRLIPTVTDNVFRNNRIAVRVQDDASVLLERNVYDGNEVAIQGGELGETDQVRTATEEDLAKADGLSIDQYRALMDRVYDEASALQGKVVYDLTTETGRFHLAVLMPWATFHVGASARDTVIEAFDAYDRSTTGDLHAEFQRMGDQRPAVDVKNPSIKDKALDRYVLEKIFVHPESYKRLDDGSLVFDRETNITRIEVRVPPTFHVVEASEGAVVESDATGREIVRMTEMGMTRVRVVMKPLTQ